MKRDGIESAVWYESKIGRLENEREYLIDEMKRRDKLLQRLIDWYDSESPGVTILADIVEDAEKLLDE